MTRTSNSLEVQENPTVKQIWFVFVVVSEELFKLELDSRHTFGVNL